MKRKDDDLVRRHLDGGLSTVAVAALGEAAPVRRASPVRRSQGQTSGQAGEELVRRGDPVTQYPTPPFPRQKRQEAPGLASLMNPPPDHGEKSYKGSDRLAGRKALITGGDSGIGRAAAIAFAREGADVAINYLPSEESDAREVVQLIRDAGRTAAALPGDIRDEAFCTKLVADAAMQLGGLDILVSNAAKQVAVPAIEDLTTEQFDATFKTNVYAMFWIIKSTLRYLPRGGTIICTTSINAYDPEENLLDYAATKAAIMNFTKGLATQVAHRGIRSRTVLDSAATQWGSAAG
jgi:NAD(P)-dependent dehydrogenase (short-subunit alcohol dehydrogenase family)